MSKKTFALGPHEEKRLEIRWGMFWRNVTISLDGARIGVIETKQQLKAGREFPLLDGSILSVSLESPWFDRTGLKLLRNGTPLPGSMTDPNRRVKYAADYLIFFGFLCLLLGLLAVIAPEAAIKELWAKSIYLAPAVLFLALGLWVLYRQSAVVIGIGLVLFLVGVILFWVEGLMKMGMLPGVCLWALAAWIVVDLVRGMKAAQWLKKNPQLVWTPSPRKTTFYFLLGFFQVGLLVLAFWVSIYGKTLDLTSLDRALTNKNPFALNAARPTNVSPQIVLPFASGSKCRPWSEISSADAGEQMCAYGVVKAAYSGGNIFYLTFAEDTNAFRLIDLNGKDLSGMKGKCVQAEGVVETYGEMAYIAVGETLKSCEK